MRKGFTLIELLIVVAIIAILAAIAVPNFLEAQTRAKVSRVLADMRSAATAIEARAVDTSGGTGEQYTLMRWSAPTVFPPRPVHDQLNGAARDFNHTTLPLELTTPVAYITSLFNDPFLRPTARRFTVIGPPPSGPVNLFSAGDPTTQNYRYDNIHQLTRVTGFQFDDRDLAEYGQWRLVSVGPDISYIGSIGRRVYDPTNGTLSVGDIIRTQKNPSSSSKEGTLGNN